MYWFVFVRNCKQLPSFIPPRPCKTKNFNKISNKFANGILSYSNFPTYVWMKLWFTAKLYFQMLLFLTAVFKNSLLHVFGKHPTGVTLGFEILFEGKKKKKENTCRFFSRVSEIFYLSEGDKIMYWLEQACLDPQIQHRRAQPRHSKGMSAQRPHGTWLGHRWLWSAEGPNQCPSGSSWLRF